VPVGTNPLSGSDARIQVFPFGKTNCAAFFFFFTFELALQELVVQILQDVNCNMHIDLKYVCHFDFEP